MKTTEQVCLHLRMYYTGINIAVAISYWYVPLKRPFNLNSGTMLYNCTFETMAERHKTDLMLHYIY
jgi:hypothetical protein